MKTLITTLAKEFGLNQQQIADFFGIDRSIVSRIQSGERSLPGKAAHKGALLLQAMQRMNRGKKKLKPVCAADWPQRLQVLQEQVLNCRVQIQQLQSAIKNLHQQQQCCDKSATLYIHIADMSKQLSDDKHTRWLAEAQYQNELAEKKCDAEQQWIMDIKLQATMTQLAYYEQQVIVIKNQINRP